MSTREQIERYLTIVSGQLGAATLTERENIREEISAHIQELLRKPGENLDGAFAQLGPPEQLGERYREILSIYQASRSYSPIVLLMFSFRRGIPGILAGIVGLAGYWLGGIFLVFGGLTLVWAAMHAGPHKPVPIGRSYSNIFEIIGSGLLLLLFSTMLLRATLRRLGRRLSPI